MHTIWKYPIPVDDTFELALPHGARFLAVQNQRQEPQAWFLVDPKATKQTRRFALAGTGHPIADADQLTHLGTFQLRDGFLVFHLFEYLA